MINEWEGKSAHIRIELKCKDHIQTLFFTAKPILRVTKSHITFRDKFNKVMTFHLDKIKNIHEIEG